MFSVLCVGLPSSAGVGPAPPAIPRPLPTSPTFVGATGAWGQLEYTPIDLVPPPDLNAIVRAVADRPLQISPRLVRGLPLAGVSAATMVGFDSHLHGEGAWRFLGDLPGILSSIDDDREKLRFARAITTTASYTIRLKVAENANVEGLVRYWSRPDHPDALRPLLESLVRVRGGGSVDLPTLLPPYANAHANRFPDAADPIEAHTDCFRASLNFFAAQPTASTDNPESVLDALRHRFRPVATPTLGNLVALLNDKTVPVHTAVYIADDLVFTKNGANVLAPWIFMKTQSMRDLYETALGRLRLVYVAALPPTQSGNQPSYR